MGLLKTLISPDSEERDMGDRMIVVTAANLLQIGEFQFLQVAYREWYNRDMPDALVSRLFTAYMLHNEVPHWTRHFARLVLARAERGALDPDDPAYHRYDHDYHTEVPDGLRRFLTAVLVLTVVMVAGVAVVMIGGDEAASVLPPYFERGELPGNS